MPTASSKIDVTYHVRSDAAAIEKRAQGIAVEQSVEMPLEAIDEPHVHAEIVGRVESIRPLDDVHFEVRIALAAETVGSDAGHLFTMLFGNTSLHDDVVLYDAELPEHLVKAFGGPNLGVAGLRALVGAGRRALTCSALKPQGAPVTKLASLARAMAEGGIDYIKDDHGLANQSYAPFRERVAAIVEALRQVRHPAGTSAQYIPSLYGDLDAMRSQIAFAREAGIRAVMITPMVAGFANFHRLVRDNPDLAFFAHPTMGGASRIAAPLLFGKLFRLLGADAVIFTGHGGRFGYSKETCAALARNALQDWHGLRPAVPVPAGGMTLARIPEILEFYSPDSMLLIGGDLLRARERIADEARAFIAQVRRNSDG